MQGLEKTSGDKPDDKAAQDVGGVMNAHQNSPDPHQNGQEQNQNSGNLFGKENRRTQRGEKGNVLGRKGTDPVAIITTSGRTAITFSAGTSSFR